MFSEFLKENYDMTVEDFNKLEKTEVYTARCIEREYESVYKEYIYKDPTEYNENDWIRL